MLCIAVDMMGGDNAPHSMVEALKIYLRNVPETSDKIKFLAYGEKEKIFAAAADLDFDISKYLNVGTIELFEFEATDKNVKPSSALRLKSDNSLSAAVKAVESNLAQAVVSGADTGYYMVLCCKLLRLQENFKRPLLVKSLPTLIPNQNVVMLDIGANSDFMPDDMLRLAKIGSDFYKNISEKKEPVVKILNIGNEKHKGNMFIRKTMEVFDAASEKNFNFQGFVEGNEIMLGKSDVIISDGFTGNVALKSLSGGMKFVIELLKTKGEVDLMKKILKIIDPRFFNGAAFLGLSKGIAVKSHGSSDGVACYHALQFAIDIISKTQHK